MNAKYFRELLIPTHLITLPGTAEGDTEATRAMVREWVGKASLVVLPNLNFDDNDLEVDQSGGSRSEGAQRRWCGNR